MGRKFRARSSQKVLEEIELLVDKYGIKELAFTDDNLTLDRERALNIFDGMKERDFDLVWVAPNGIALYAIDEELIEKMKESGCYSLYLPIESGVQEVLDKIIRKPIRLERVRRIVKKIKEFDIETVGMFIIGFPGETLDQMKQTIDFAQSLDLDYVSFSIATPYPGTDLYEIAKENGYLVNDFTEEDLIYGFGKGHIKTPEFTPEEVLRLRKEGWQRINFDNPEKAIKVKEMLSR
jgi:magnesium-protoporphyrin IX monomethyl ester (oxidative) cyclase